MYVSIEVQLEEILPANAFSVFWKYATHKDDREPTFPHYRLATVDWSRQINQYHEHSFK